MDYREVAGTCHTNSGVSLVPRRRVGASEDVWQDGESECQPDHKLSLWSIREVACAYWHCTWSTRATTACQRKHAAVFSWSAAESGIRISCCIICLFPGCREWDSITLDCVCNEIDQWWPAYIKAACHWAGCSGRETRILQETGRSLLSSRFCRWLPCCNADFWQVQAHLCDHQARSPVCVWLGDCHSCLSEPHQPWSHLLDNGCSFCGWILCHESTRTSASCHSEWGNYCSICQQSGIK